MVRLDTERPSHQPGQSGEGFYSSLWGIPVRYGGLLHKRSPQGIHQAGQGKKGFSSMFWSDFGAAGAASPGAHQHCTAA